MIRDPPPSPPCLIQITNHCHDSPAEIEAGGRRRGRWRGDRGEMVEIAADDIRNDFYIVTDIIVNLIGGAFVLIV